MTTPAKLNEFNAATGQRRWLVPADDILYLLRRTMAARQRRGGGHGGQAAYILAI